MKNLSIFLLLVVISGYAVCGQEPCTFTGNITKELDGEINRYTVELNGLSCVVETYGSEVGWAEVISASGNGATLFNEIFMRYIIKWYEERIKKQKNEEQVEE